MKLKDVVARMGLTNILDEAFVTPSEATALLIEGEEMQWCDEFRHNRASRNGGSD